MADDLGLTRQAKVGKEPAISGKELINLKKMALYAFLRDKNSNIYYIDKLKRVDGNNWYPVYEDEDCEEDYVGSYLVLTPKQADEKDFAGMTIDSKEVVKTYQGYTFYIYQVD